MSIETRVATAEDRDRWNGLVERSPHGTPLHRIEALDVLAEHAEASLHPMIGFKGQEPVGLFPLFEIERGPFTAVFSPPPDLKVQYLGPILTNLEHLKRRKLERRNRQFVEGCLAYVDEELDPSFEQYRTAPPYDDPRTFRWRSASLTVKYTYVVDIDREVDELFDSFSSDARKNVRDFRDSDAELRVDHRGDLDRIHEQVVDRHREQGIEFPASLPFLRDLETALPDDTLQTLAVERDDEFLGGTIALRDAETAYVWIGGAKTDADVDVNDVTTWRLMEEGIEDGLTAVDLVGANNERIAGFKAKFAPELRPYYRVQRSSPTMRALVGLYDRVR